MVDGERLYPELPYHIGFFGRVHPRATKISIHEVRVIHYLDHGKHLTLNIVPRITNSVIAIDCYFDPLINNHASVILAVVITAIRAQIDLVSFMLGAGTIVSIDWMKDYTGTTSTIALSQRDLAPLCTAFNEYKNYKELKNIATADQAMSLALSDLIMAQTAPLLAEVNCGRAIEGIRHIIAGQGTEAKAAWPIMREALKIDKSYLDLITDNSIPRRHGELKIIEENTVQEILRHSWTIMDRFFHYRLQGDTLLSVDQFPILSDEAAITDLLC